MDEYISREEAIEAIRQTYCPNCDSCNGIMCKACGYKDCMDIVDDVKSADVQPVKHGRWIEVSPKHSRCSVCDTTCLIAVYPISKGANFCPNCGTRMEGDSEC